METQEKLIIKLGANMPQIDKVRYEKEGSCLMLYLDQEDAAISQSLIRLFGRLCSRASYHPQKKFFFSLLKNEDFQKTETIPDNLTDIFKKFLPIIPAKIKIIVYETSGKEIQGFIQAENKVVLDQFWRLGKISRLSDPKASTPESSFFKSQTGDLKETSLRLFNLIKTAL